MPRKVAAKIATMRQGKRTDLSPLGERLSQGQAAELLNVGKHSVERVKKVLDEGSLTLVNNNFGRLVPPLRFGIVAIPNEQ